MTATTKVAEYTVAITPNPGSPFPWSWEIEGARHPRGYGNIDGIALTRWGARWAARRACCLILAEGERWTFTREVTVR